MIGSIYICSALNGQNFFIVRQGITDEDVLLGLLARKRRFVLYTVVGLTKRKSVKVLARNRRLVW